MTDRPTRDPEEPGASSGREAPDFYAAFLASVELVDRLIQEHGAQVLDFSLDSKSGSFLIRLPVKWRPQQEEPSDEPGAPG